MSARPTIGVSVSERSGWRIFPLLAFNIWLAGGRAQRWQADRDARVEDVDGVLVGGGDDISPDLYGAQLVTAARLDHRRDAFESRLVRDAWAQNTPILGICRGAQMMNVALGGSLLQDAYDVYRGSRHVKTILPRKTVCPEDGTRLARLFGDRDTVRVNALHSQSVDTLGHGLIVSARDGGGMVQAIERVRDPFALGVQWHPEHLFYLRSQRRIFRAFVTAAAAYADSRGQLGAVDRDDRLGTTPC